MFLTPMSMRPIYLFYEIRCDLDYLLYYELLLHDIIMNKLLQVECHGITRWNYWLSATAGGTLTGRARANTLRV